MGSADRSKKRDLLWKKAILHFSLCFVMGFFTGFAPTSTENIFSGQVTTTYHSTKVQEISPQPVSVDADDTDDRSFNRSLLAKAVEAAAEAAVSPSPVASVVTPNRPVPEEVDEEAETEDAPRLLILITTTRSNDPFKSAFLTRLAHTLKLVPPPLLWIVVEAYAEAPKTAEMLRMTGVMYRHLVFRGNFTDPQAEVDHQRNVALNHIEHHHLDGIVHFAELSNVYDLPFFEEIRDIEVFGTWPVASVSANRWRVTIEGPVCRSSEVLGWHFVEQNSNSDDKRVGISSFAFNSSILWDPERWGRPSSVPDTSQDSIKFVQEVVLEDESKLMAFPSDCSRVMLWHLHVPRTLFSGLWLPPSNTTANGSQR